MPFCADAVESVISFSRCLRIGLKIEAVVGGAV